MTPSNDQSGSESPQPPFGDSDPLADVAERLAFLELTSADQGRLRELVGKFDDFADELVEAFYRHLFRFQDSARFLRDPQLVARLKSAQRDHFLSLLEANWDADYFARRLRVGRRHAEVGIDPELFLGAYHQYVQLSLAHYCDESGALPAERVAGLKSLLKVVFLDLGLTLEAYFSQATETIRQALDMYWRANVELRQFAHLASHDLKTPLATVANFCDEALDEFGAQIPPAARELIDSARRRTFRMSAMIDELLSAATAFQPDGRLERISVGAVLNEALERLRPLIHEKQIKVVTPDSPPDVWGDAIRLRESFYNLLSNAVKYVAPQIGRVVVDVRPHDDGVELTFTDNGPGIAADELQRIFTPFYRSPTHRDVPGSGLGLYFTKSMLEFQGGRIWVESTPGRCSRFHVVLQNPPPDAEA